MSNQSEYVRQNIKKSQEISASSRFNKQGLTEQKAKLNSKNFDKLMQQRGLTKEQRADLKASVESGSRMEVRHAKAGEKFVTTHGVEKSSGVFVSKKSLGETSKQRIDKGSLPHSNTAEFETKIELSKDQNLIYSKIAPQSKFEKMDPNQSSRKGGGEQVITDGGYSSGAIINRDSKYPVPVTSDFQKRAHTYKQQNSIKSTKSASAKNTTKTKGISK